MIEELYKEEQKLLKMLAEEKGRERQNAIKRTIERINKDLESLDT